jgi:hypothetical protein
MNLYFQDKAKARHPDIQEVMLSNIGPNYFISFAHLSFSFSLTSISLKTSP